MDGLVAGMQIPQGLLKVGVAMKGAGIYHSHWYSPGRPGAGSAPSSGVNGGSHSSTLSGQIPHTNPVSGNSYLSRLAIAASQPGTYLLCDRLWSNSGLGVTTTGAQAITPAALPSRDRDGSTNGEDVLCAIEWSAAGGAGTPTITITYTNAAGTAGRVSPSITGNTTPNAGTFEIFPLAAGDTGVRSVSVFNQSATRTSGTFHLILFRILAQIEITAANIGAAIDFLSSGGPRLYDGIVPFIVQLPTATTATTFAGQYAETQG